MKQLRKRMVTSILDMAASRWEPYSRLILVSDNAGWVLDWEMRAVRRIAQGLGISLAGERWRQASKPQSIFLASQFFMLKDDWLEWPHRIGFSYFHGLPGTGDPLFDRVYASLCAHHDRVSRIQASHRQMRDVILQSGIEASKVMLIPIGIDLDFFPFRTEQDRQTARQKLGLPASAFVIGSFQKDGVGWGDGMEPKLIKGPDVFLSVISQLKARIPEIFVLLSGPARGYVKAGLEKMGVAYKHIYLDDYPAIHRLYHALDAYLVSSRQEGGPKAVLESMAAGVPIISTAVGQATDLIEHGKNGWLAPSEDVEGLVHWLEHLRGLDRASLAEVLARGRSTAEANTYQAQIPLWTDFMKGFVTWHP